jgi:hypothetical protein
MQLTGIIAISGKPGLYKVIAQARQGLIVESLLDGRRSSISASQQVSALEDISIFTNEEDVPLKVVYEKCFDFEGGKKSIDHKSNTDELYARLNEFFPEFDKERVRPNDVKKLFMWYNLLVDKGLLVKEEVKKEEATSEESSKEEVTEEKVEKPKAKKKAKKSDEA